MAGDVVKRNSGSNLGTTKLSASLLLQKWLVHAQLQKPKKARDPPATMLSDSLQNIGVAWPADQWRDAIWKYLGQIYPLTFLTPAEFTLLDFTAEISSKKRPPPAAQSKGNPETPPGVPPKGFCDRHVASVSHAPHTFPKLPVPTRRVPDKFPLCSHEFPISSRVFAGVPSECPWWRLGPLLTVCFFLHTPRGTRVTSLLRLPSYSCAIQCLQAEFQSMFVFPVHLQRIGSTWWS